MRKFAFLFLLPGLLLAANWSTRTMVAPAVVAAGSTNDLALVSSNAIDLDFATGAGNSGARVQISFTSNAGNTNGAVTVVLSGSSDENAQKWDSPAESLFQFSARPNGTNQVVKGDWQQVVGVRRILVSRVINTGSASVSNLVVNLCYAPKQ